MATRPKEWMTGIAMLMLLLLSRPAAEFGEAADAGAGGSDWPQWLGPTRDGVAPSVKLLKQWPEEGPSTIWRRQIGEGFSGFSIVGDFVYTMFTDGPNEYLACLNAENGSERWRLRTGARYVERQGGNGPRCTPSVDGDLVYAIGASGELVAANATTGRQVWQHHLMRDSGAKRPRWGFSGSPLVLGNTLVVEAGGSGGRAFVAFDSKTGAVVWTSQDDKIGYSSPVSVTAAGVRQVIFFSGVGLASVSPDDGELYWRHSWPTSYDVNSATPIFIPPDRFFISSGYDTGATVVQVAVDGDGLKAKEVWRNREMKNHMATSVLHDDHIYGIDNSILKCIDAATGSTRWKARGYGKGTLILADGHLLVLGDKGKLGLIEANPSAFREVASAQVLSGLCWTAPSLARGRLYLRSMEEAVCLQIAEKM